MAWPILQVAGCTDRHTWWAFVPSHNGLPPARAGEDLVAEARNIDTMLAIDNGTMVIRADAAGGARAES
jgi:hypothetical protein